MTCKEIEINPERTSEASALVDRELIELIELLVAENFIVLHLNIGKSTLD